MLTTLCNALDIDMGRSGLMMLDAAALLPPPPPAPTDEPAWCETHRLARYMPPLVPYPLATHQPALIWLRQHPDSPAPPALALIQQTLLVRYPPRHPLQLVTMTADGDVDERTPVVLEALGDLPVPAPAPDTPAALYVPPLPPLDNCSSTEGLAWVVMRLLGPEGCPWDRKQTFGSLRAGLQEETFEVLEALDAQDMGMLAEELGDLLLQVFIFSEMARQAGHFQFDAVVNHVTTKLIRRHPHVFGALDVRDSGEVLHNWEAIKAQELREKGRPRSSVLDGIPPALPALAAAQKLSKKAARAGFDWDTLDGVWAKFHEELEELREAVQQHDTHQSDATHAHLAEELGDLLFVVACLARWLGLDAESALREVNTKFRRRFAGLEALLEQRGLDLHTLPVEAKLALWREAKADDQ